MEMTSQILNPIKILTPAYFLIVGLILAVYLINYSPFHFGKKDGVKLGETDFTQDMYGWSIIGKSFKQIAIREETKGTMLPGSDLISFRWFPGAHLDFYVAYPAGRKLFLIGTLQETHKYAWVNEQRGGLIPERDYYYIAPSNYFRDPTETFGNYFKQIEVSDTIKVERGGETVRYAFIYRLKGYRGNFKTPIKPDNIRND